MNFNFDHVLLIAPLLVVVGMGCVVLLAETFIKAGARAGLAWLSAAGALIALGLTVNQWADAAEPQVIFSGMLVVDRMSLFLDGTFLLAGALVLLMSHAYMREHEFEFGEFYALVLFTLAGMMMVVHAVHLMSLLIGIETMSLGAYVLTGCLRRSPRSTEGALKYFLMGAFATGFLIYGMGLVYGSTGGALTYEAIAARGADLGSDPLFLIGLYFILGVLVFKVAAVPFHMWAPDAYEGAPTNVTGFMASGVKAAAFGGLMRLFGTAFGDPALVADATGWVGILAIIAAITMVFANLAALRQDNVKRLLAYSSVAHAGFLLIGVAAMGLRLEGARSAVLFYLVAYSFTTIGIFTVVAWVGRRRDERLALDDWAGLGQERPGLALAMTIFLLSLGGVPPTGGFLAKFSLLRIAASSPRLFPLVIIGVLTSVVSLYYYLRVVMAMYFRAPARVREGDGYASAATQFVVVAAVTLVVLLGVWPEQVVQWTMAAAGEVKAAVATVALTP